MPDASFPSLNFAETILDAYKFQLNNLLLAFEPSLADSPDVLPLDKWTSIAKGNTKVVHIGVSQRIYPQHFSAYNTFWKKMSAWGKKNTDRHDMWLTPQEVQAEMDRIGIRHLVKQHGE